MNGKLYEAIGGDPTNVYDLFDQLYVGSTGLLRPNSVVYSEIAGRHFHLYPEALKTYFFTFNAEAIYYNVTMKDKCIPVKALDTYCAISYMAQFVDINSRHFKDLSFLVVETKKPAGVKLMNYCPNIHDEKEKNHIGISFTVKETNRFLINFGRGKRKELCFFG